MGEFLFDFLFDLLFEGSFGLAGSKKVPLAVRIIAGVLFGGIVAVLFALFFFLSYRVLLASVPAGIFLFAFFLFLIGIAAFGVWKKVKLRKGSKQTADTGSSETKL